MSHQRRIGFWVSGVMILFLGIVVLWVVTAPEDTSSQDRVTVRYKPTRGAGGRIVKGAGMIFTATNHTSMNLMIQYFGIELRQGTNWVTQLAYMSAFPQPMWWSNDFGGQDEFLGPHVGSQSPPLSYPNPPSGTIWRARFFVQQELTGREKFTARLGLVMQNLRLTLKYRKRIGSFNPFADMRHFGNAVEIVTDDVAED